MEQGVFCFLATASASDKNYVDKTEENYSTTQNKTPTCFPKDLKHHRVQLTSELREQTQSITKSYCGWKYCTLIPTSKYIPFVPSYPKKSPNQCFFPPLQPVLEKPKPQIHWARCETSMMLPFVQQWIYPRIFYTKNINWLKLGRRSQPAQSWL